MPDAVICAAVRTPIGNYGGAFKDVSAIELGAEVLRSVLKNAGVDPSQVDEVIMGNVLSAGLGQNPARQMAMSGGIPREVPAMTLNKVCGSGLRAVSLAAQIIKAGDAQCILCGGSENMSRAPYLLPDMRWGKTMGDASIVDAMVHDGLHDIFNRYHMGITAENIAKQWNISRQEQDAFALGSYEKALKAQAAGAFDEEILPITVPRKKGEPTVIERDEYPRPTTLEKLSSLKPVFTDGGTVTAGNASGINDGAAALIVTSDELAREKGFPVLAAIRSYASAGVDPSVMGYGPVPAVRKALNLAGWSIKDVDLIEANEAFASQSIAVIRDLDLDSEKVNVNGGAIALGHPIGCSGARILTTLLHAMKQKDKSRGLAALCIGGGMGTALCVERI